jgi:hypothetical protein
MNAAVSSASGCATAPPGRRRSGTATCVVAQTRARSPASQCNASIAWDPMFAKAPDPARARSNCQRIGPSGSPQPQFMKRTSAKTGAPSDPPASSARTGERRHEAQPERDRMADAASRRGREHRLCLPRVQGERLVAEHVCAARDRRDRLGVVEVVRGGDDDDVGSRLGEHRIEAGEDGGDPELLRGGSCPHLRGSAERDDLGARDGLEATGVADTDSRAGDADAERRRAARAHPGAPLAIRLSTVGLTIPSGSRPARTDSTAPTAISSMACCAASPMPPM